MEKIDFEALKEYEVLARERLSAGRCPQCDIPLIRGKTKWERIKNLMDKIKYCPTCGHTLAGT